MPSKPVDEGKLKSIQILVGRLKNGRHPRIVEDIFNREVPEFLKSEDRLPKFDYKNFKYEELIKSIKKSLKPLSSALSSIQLDATKQQYFKEIYKILTDENYKYSIPHILIKQ